MSDMPIYRVHMASISRKKSALGLYLSYRFDETINKYSSVIIESQSYSYKLECHSLRSERIYASWAAADQEALVLIHLNFLLVMSFTTFCIPLH